MWQGAVGIVPADGLVSPAYIVARPLPGVDVRYFNYLFRTACPFGLPSTYVKSITVTVKGRLYSLDVADMYNAWGSRPLEYKGVIRYFGGTCLDSENCRFRGVFSDAAGSFGAEWYIIKGLAIRTVISSSSDIIQLFAKHID
jgi:hypothetical protein